MGAGRPLLLVYVPIDESIVSNALDIGEVLHDCGGGESDVSIVVVVTNGR